MSEFARYIACARTLPPTARSPMHSDSIGQSKPECGIIDQSAMVEGLEGIPLLEALQR